MFENAFEFVRIADAQPSHEKVQLRIESAKSVLSSVTGGSKTTELLCLIEGTVGGFVSPPFKQDSLAVNLIIDAIKANSVLPTDLTENALDLRAVAGLAVGELLKGLANGSHDTRGILAALAISAAELRPLPSDKHVRSMVSMLIAEAHRGLAREAQERRSRVHIALDKLQQFEVMEGTGDLSNERVVDAFDVLKKAMVEVRNQASLDREELEILWWMFSGYSEIDQKPFNKLKPSGAAFAAGIELARHSLLPPSPSAGEMIRRLVEFGRKPNSLTAITLDAAAVEWSDGALDAFIPTDARRVGLIAQGPSLMPISLACRRLREAGNLGKDFAATTGLPATLALPPVDWGIQVFREAILLRTMKMAEED